MNKKILKISLVCLLLLCIGATCFAASVNYVPEVGIPGIVGAGKSITFNGLNDFITRLIVFIYRVSFIIAFFMLVYTGFLYIFAKDSPSNVKNAMESLRFVGIGLGLILFSYVILYTINPQLVRLSLFNFNIKESDVVAILPESINKMKITDMTVIENLSAEDAVVINAINEMVKLGNIGGSDYKGVLIDLKDPKTEVKPEIKKTIILVSRWFMNNNHRDCGPLDIGPIKTGHSDDPYGCSCHIKSAAIDFYVFNDKDGCNNDLYNLLVSNEDALGIDVIDERGSKQTAYSTSPHFHVQTKKCSSEWGQCMADN